MNGPSVTDLAVAILIGTLGVAFIVVMVIAIVRDNRAARYPKDWLTGKPILPGTDPSCPDCGLDPHRTDCRFAWMGPPPTEFVFITVDDDEEKRT